MTDIMAKDRVKKLVVQRMLDRGWKMPTGASVEALTEDYIADLKHFSTDELNAAWYAIRNNDDRDKTFRYWPSPEAWAHHARMAKRENSPAQSDVDMKSYNEADEAARSYSGKRIGSDLQWAWRSRHLNEIREFLRSRAMEQALVGVEINVVVPDHKLAEWQASVVDVGELYDIGQFKTAGRLVRKLQERNT